MTYDITRYDGYEIELDADSAFVEYDDMAALIAKIKQSHQEEVDDLRGEVEKLRARIDGLQAILFLAHAWLDAMTPYNAERVIRDAAGVSREVLWCNDENAKRASQDMK